MKVFSFNVWPECKDAWYTGWSKSSESFGMWIIWKLCTMEKFDFYIYAQKSFFLNLFDDLKKNGSYF